MGGDFKRVVRFPLADPDLQHVERVAIGALDEWQALTSGEYRDEERAGRITFSKAERERQELSALHVCERLLRELLEHPFPYYVASVNPLRGTYQTLGLFGEWSEDDRAVWKSWMADGTRLIAEGKLSRFLAESLYGTYFLYKWGNKTLISEIPGRLNWAWAVSVPIMFAGRMVGAATFSLPDQKRAQQLGPKLFVVSQRLLLQPVLAAAQIGESHALEILTTVWHEHVLKIRARLGPATAGLRRIEEMGPQPAVLAEVKEIEEKLTFVDRFTYGLAATFSPSSATSSDASIEVSALEDVVQTVWEVIKSEYPHLDFDPELAISASNALPLGKSYALPIMRELLANSAKAVVEAVRHLGGRPEFMAAIAGTPPIAVELFETEHAHILRLVDRGIGMSGFVLRRAAELGFTTRVGGTGVGLTIVRNHVEAAGGSMTITSKSIKDTRSDFGTSVEISLESTSSSGGGEA